MSDMSTGSEASCPKWAALASHFIGACFDVAKPFIDKDFLGLDPYVRFVSTQLFIDCHLTSESALILIANDKEWDADSLCRSVMEGSVKYIYMLIGDTVEVRKKAEEYWDIMPSFESIKRSDRVKRFLETVSDTSGMEWRPLRELIMEDEAVEAISRTLTAKQIREITERWRFSNIRRQFEESHDTASRELVHLAFSYGMSSHTLHKDGDGTAMVWDRYRRSAECQTAVALAHSSRVVLDVCTFAQLRLRQLLKVCNRSTEPILVLQEQYKSFFDELSGVYDDFTCIEYGEELVDQ